MNLTETPEFISWPETHYVFIGKTGPFGETAPACWGELHRNLTPALKASGFLSLYKLRPQMLYRAGVSVQERPESLPPGFAYELFPGGNYARFTLTGPYSLLPEASGRVHQLITEKNLRLREAFFIENYVNNPDTTPPEKRVTEILVPVL